MKKRPVISVKRAVQVYREILSVRRLYAEDTQFFRMDEFWADFFETGEEGEIRTYRAKTGEALKLRAGVIEFGEKTILTCDERLLEKAKAGDQHCNFVLAHEASHLALDHYAKSAVVKNFQLFESESGMANLPPNLEELEANYGAAFLQCGVALLDASWDPIRLAKRAHSDVSYVKKARKMIQLDAFRRELNRPKRALGRVVL